MNLHQTLLAFLLLAIVNNGWAQEAAKPVAPEKRNQPPSETVPSESTDIAMLWETAQSLAADGKTSEAIDAGGRLLTLERKIYGDSAPGLIRTLEWLSRHQVSALQLEAAAKSSAEVLQIRRMFLGSEHWETVNAHWRHDYVLRLVRAERRVVRKLMTIEADFNSLYSQKEFADAASSLAKLVAIEEGLLGAEHPELAGTLAGLSGTWSLAKQYDRAEESARRALRIRLNTLGDKHPDTAMAEYLLAKCLLEKGPATEAVDLFFSAAETYHQLADVEKVAALHGHAVGTIDRLWESARARSDRESMRGVAALAEKMLPVEMRLLGENHDNVTASISFLAHAHELTGSLDYAVSKRKELLGRTTEKFGAGHWKVIDARLDLADTISLRSLTVAQRDGWADFQERDSKLLGLYKAGKYAEGVQTCEAMIQFLRASMGRHHRGVASVMQELAWFYRAMGEFDKAEELYLEAMTIDVRTIGKAHPEYARRMSSLASVYRSKAQFDKAIIWYKQAISIGQAALGGVHRNVTTNRNSLAACYTEVGNYEEAERILQDNLLNLETTHGKNHPATATSMASLGELYQLTGQLAKARPFLEQSFELHRATLGDRHVTTAKSQASLGRCLSDAAEYERAEALLQNAFEVYRDFFGRDDTSTLKVQSDLAVLYDGKGDYNRAKQIHLQVLQARKKVHGPKHPDVAISLSNLSLVLDSLGDRKEARRMCHQALDIQLRVLGPEHPACARTWNNLGIMYSDIGEYGKAKTYYQKAADLNKQLFGDKHLNYALSLHNLASLHHSLGDYGKAEKLYLDAIDIRRTKLGEYHPDFALTLGNLAVLYSDREDYENAAKFHQQALEINRARLGETHPGVASDLANLGVVQQKLGRYQQAEESLRESLLIRKKHFGDGHLEVALTLNNLGLLHQELKEYSEAEVLTRQASEIVEKTLGDRHPTYVIMLLNLASLAKLQGNPVEARRLSEQALVHTRANVDATATALSERQQLAMQKMLRNQLDDFLSLALQHPEMHARAAEEVLRWKGTTLARQRAMRLAASDPRIAAYFGDLRDVIDGLSALDRARRSGQKTDDDWKNRYKLLTERKERLEAEISRSSREAGHAPKLGGITEIQAALPEGTVLVDYLQFQRSKPAKTHGNWVFEASVAATVLRKGSPPKLIDLGALDGVADLVAMWRDTFGRSQRSVRAGQRLRQRLWDPLVPHIGAARTVLVCSDGHLARIPICALPNENPDRLLIEDFRVVSVSVPQLLPELLSKGSERNLAAASLLLLGDVNYGLNQSGASRPWGRLPNTSREIDAIFALHAGDDPDGNGLTRLTGNLASEARIREELPRHSMLHFATHGLFEHRSEAVPPRSSSSHGRRVQPVGVIGFNNQSNTIKSIRSGLVLANANVRAELQSQPDEPILDDDGFLMMEEILSMPLETATLVVLSACDTAQGEMHGGEGLIGIQRAFQIAGARSVIASLWKVDDRATQELMKQFYTNLWVKNQSKIDALRNAQLFILKNPVLADGTRLTRGKPTPVAPKDPNAKPRTTDRSDPYFWAAWTLSGDWR